MKANPDVRSAALKEPKDAKEHRRKTALLVITLLSFLLFLNNCITAKSIVQHFSLTSCKTGFVANKNEFILNISIGSFNKKISIHRNRFNKIKDNEISDLFLSGSIDNKDKQSLNN